MSGTPPRRAPLPPEPQAPAILKEMQSEVSAEATPLLDFIIKHAALIAGALVLFVAVLAGTAGYNWYQTSAVQKAQTELTRVVMSTEGAERVKALEAFIAKAPPSIHTAALLALADAASTQDDFVTAAKAYGQVAADAMRSRRCWIRSGSTGRR